MRRLLHTAAALVTVVVMTLACGARPLDPPEEDFTEVVERICDDYCTMNLDCREPAAFGSHGECEDICLGLAYIYNDTDCGDAKRDMYECISSTQTCELFNDTYNVHAEVYTCKTEKDLWVNLKCGQSDEDPLPQETP